MAGEWVKMRTSLLTNPKVNGIAKALECDRAVSKYLTTGFNGQMSEIVTRNVMRHVTVSSLLVIWGSANEHTKDGVFLNSELSDLDDMAGIPGFGDAMSSVGWAIYNPEENSVTLPNFNEYNTSGHERSAGSKTAAQRQKEYRDRKKSQQSDVTRYVTRDVTNDVTSNRREEKRREDIKPPKSPKGEPEGFAEFYAAYPRHEARAKAAQAFAKVKTPLKTLLDAIAAHKKTEQWTKSGGEFIPLPASWLNGKRWEDEIAIPTASAAADPDTRASIEAEGRAKGMGPWDELKEPFQAYKARVRAPAPKQDPAIAAMVAGALTRRGIPA